MPLLYHKTVYNPLAQPVTNHTTLYSPRRPALYKINCLNLSPVEHKILPLNKFITKSNYLPAGRRGRRPLQTVMVHFLPHGKLLLYLYLLPTGRRVVVPYKDKIHFCVLYRASAEQDAEASSFIPNSEFSDFIGMITVL